VSRIRNATQFKTQFLAAWANYETRYKPQIDRIRAKYVHEPSGLVQPDVDESLEAHGRLYLIDALLAALNWKLDSAPGEEPPILVPEAPVSSLERGTRRFFDYLGLESDTLRPLLIVEAKRPRSSLPQKVDSVSEPEHDLSIHILPFTICEGIAGARLIDEWNEWLTTLGDYVRSADRQAGEVPSRVVITNGDWLILFLDPADTFLGGQPDPEKILVWNKRDDIERRCAELFQWLEYYAVLGEAPTLTVGTLRFYGIGDTVDRATYGLRLHYIEEPEFDYEPSPVIKVRPILFLRSLRGAWLCVERQGQGHTFLLPHRYDDLLDHLKAVGESLETLLQEVNAVLQSTLVASPLADHYITHDSLIELPGVKETSYGLELPSTQYRVVTGDRTHYILPTPSISECPHHDWLKCRESGVEANPGPVTRRRVRFPRSFFISGESHHCAHCEVASAKAEMVTLDNRDRCGPRSNQNGHAFCEIFSFEEHLCCRVCVFETVCTNAEVFYLPCEVQKTS
jgi:hypothetical protein